MAKKVINVGIAENDSTGDSLRTGAIKINDNFTEIYNALGGESGAPLSIVSKIVAGNGIAVSSGYGDVLVTNKIATADEVGGIRLGTGILVTEDGVLSVTPYELPKASESILGGIKVGSGLEIDNQGILSALPGAYSLPKASDTVLGGVKVGTGLTINQTGVLSVTINEYALPTATESVLGGVKIGARLSIVDGVLSADLQTSASVDRLVADTNTVILGTNGRLALPTGGVQIGDSFTATVAVGANTTIYSTDGQYIRAIKMFVFAEKINNGYESQACEIIGTIDESSNIIYTSVYGVVYTGASPLFTISSNYVLATQTFNITAMPTGTDDITIRTQVTEMYGTRP